MEETDATRRIGVAMSRLMRAAQRARAQDAATGGFFHSMALLGALHESGPMRSNLLAEAVLSDPSTISRQVATLVEQGLVAREPDPEDGRATLLAITPAGRAVVATKMRMRDEQLAAMTAAWTDGDRERFADLFDRFASEFATFVNDKFLAARPASPPAPADPTHADPTPHGRSLSAATRTEKS